MPSILVIDDTPLNLILLKSCLTQAGYEVETCSDGEEGWRRLEERPFDLLLLDWLMPPPDGATLLARLKSDPNLAHLPVLLISSEAVTDSLTSTQQAQLAGKISKPFTPSTVLSAVENALSSSV